MSTKKAKMLKLYRQLMAISFVTAALVVNRETCAQLFLPPKLTAGTYEALVVFARFSDDPPKEVPSWADDLFNPDVPGSVSHYYEDQSIGRLHLRGTVLPRVYTSSGPRASYLAQDATELGGFGRFVREVLEGVDPDVDFGRFDGDGDGVVDLIVVLVEDEPIPNFILGPATGYGRLWSEDDDLHTDDGVRVSKNSGVIALVRSFPYAVGSIAHELGHWLGLPDLGDLSKLKGETDPSEDSAGIGFWGLMGWGALGWDGTGTQGPTPLGAWEREQLGWVEVMEEAAPGHVHLSPVAWGGKVLKVWVRPWEYFLFEVRDPDAGYYEKGCPGRGLLVWHVDISGYQDDERRKVVDVECADGRYLDAGYPLGHKPDPLAGGDNLDFWAHDEGYRRVHGGNRGDGTDLFDGVRFREFAPWTNPNTHCNEGTPSGLVLRNVRVDRTGASFDLGWEGRPELIVEKFRVFDETGDSLFEPGERGWAILQLRNGGEAPTGRVEVKLKSDSPVVAPCDTTITRFLRYVGDTARVTIPIRIALHLVPGSEEITLTAMATPEWGEGPKIQSIKLPSVIPELEVLDVEILDGGSTGWGDGDGSLSPGEIFSLKVVVSSGTGWEPWPFRGMRIRFPDLSGGPILRKLIWQEQEDTTGVLKMQGDMIVPSGFKGELSGILELIGYAGVIWADTLRLRLMGGDTTPPRVRGATAVFDGEVLTISVPDILVDEGGRVIRMAARLVLLPDSMEVAKVPLRREEKDFVGRWPVPSSLVGAVLGVAVEAEDDAGNEATTGLLRQVRIRPYWGVQSLPEGAIARLGKGTVRKVGYSPDGALLAVGGGMGVWLYDASTLAEVELVQGYKFSFSPDGSWLATWDLNGTIRLWDLGQREEVATFKHTGVFSIGFSPDGRVLISASVDTVHLWDVSGRTRMGAVGGASSLAFSPDGRMFAVGCRDGTIHLWDMEQRAEVAISMGHTDRVECLAFSPDGRMLASGSGRRDPTVRLWDVERREEVGALRGHTDAISRLAFSPDGAVLASGSWDGTVRLWDVGRQTEIAVFEKDKGPVNLLAFTSDSRMLVATLWNSAYLWDVGLRREVAVLWGSSSALSPDYKVLALGGRDGTIRLWDLEQQREVAVLGGHADMISRLAFSPDGRTLVSKAGDIVRLWDLERGEEIAALKYTSGVNSVAFGPDGRMLASGGGGKVYLWDVEQHMEVAVLKGGASSVAFSPDGKVLASGGPSGIHLWDVERQVEVASFGHNADCIAFSPDGRILASGGWDRIVRLWDVGQQREIAALKGHVDAIRSLAFRPDGRVLASGDRSGRVRLWDVEQQTEIAVLDTSYPHLYALSFSPDGTVLAVGNSDGADLWDVASRRKIVDFKTEALKVFSALGFGPDGRTLALGGLGGTIWLWDVAQRREIAVLKGHTCWVTSLAFSPDGTMLASGSHDGTVVLWDLLRVTSTSVPDRNPALPERTALLPAYPNPSNLGVWIPYELAGDAKVTIRIYNILGQVVRTLDAGRKPAGRYLAYWDGRTDDGEEVASGVYIYSLQAGDFSAARKMAVVK